MKHLFYFLVILGLCANTALNIAAMIEVNCLRQSIESLEQYFDNRMYTHSEFADATYSKVKELDRKVEFNSNLLTLSYQEFEKLCHSVNDRFKTVADLLLHD